MNFLFSRYIQTGIIENIIFVVALFGLAKDFTIIAYTLSNFSSSQEKLNVGKESVPSHH